MSLLRSGGSSSSLNAPVSATVEGENFRVYSVMICCKNYAMFAEDRVGSG